MTQTDSPDEMQGAFPAASITNGIVRAKLFLPDPLSGFYRGTRFDWSGVVAELTCGGHSYVGQWYPQHDPLLHEATVGPVEAFVPIGYDDADPGDSFLAIGIGWLRRPDSEPYRFSRPYEIVDGGRWTSNPAPDRVEFRHEVDGASGYAYAYDKTVRLLPDEPILQLEHRLRNTGTRPLTTSVFNHNFFMLDRQPVGPALSISFPFRPERVEPSRGFGEIAEVQDHRIRYRRLLETGEIVASGFRGFSDNASDYDIRLENADSGAGMRITGDRPISRLYFWSIRTTACPEPYIAVSVEPGEEFTWSISYELYSTGAG